VAYYRRRRGYTREVLAGLVGKTVSWLEKIESGRANLQVLSSIAALASALDISPLELMPDDIVDVDDLTRGHSIPALRQRLLSYRFVNPRYLDHETEPMALVPLTGHVTRVWDGYQASRTSSPSSTASCQSPSPRSTPLAPDRTESPSRLSSPTCTKWRLASSGRSASKTWPSPARTGVTGSFRTAEIWQPRSQCNAPSHTPCCRTLSTRTHSPSSTTASLQFEEATSMLASFPPLGLFTSSAP